VPKPSRESDLYEAVRDFLANQGFTVRGEVHGCDVVGTRGDEVVVVELKRHLSVDLLAQGVRRQRLTDVVYVAVPEPSGEAAWTRVRHALPVVRRLELGLLTVGPGHVRVVTHPLPSQRRRERRRTRALLVEMAGRSTDGNLGGTTGRTLLTAYREQAIHVAVALERFGPSTPAELRAWGTGVRTLPILSANHYGWFERVDRGVYRLSPGAVDGLAQWPRVADAKRALLPAEVVRP
jgi:hypothetical protein